MATRRYGQFCGVARAMELVGERWAMLIVRDLLVGPRRFTDLRRELPGIPSNILTDRLREMERGGVVQRRALPQPASGVVYELTPWGRELDAVVLALGRWGAQTLDAFREGETVSTESMVMALRSTFVPDNARGITATWELRVGPVTVHARIADGRLSAGEGAVTDADLVIEAFGPLTALLTGEIDAATAIATGLVRITGPVELLDRFATVFRIAGTRAASVLADG